MSNGARLWESGTLMEHFQSWAQRVSSVICISLAPSCSLHSKQVFVTPLNTFFCCQLIMKFLSILCFITFTSVTISYPIDIRSEVTSLDFNEAADTDAAAGSVVLSDAASNSTLDLSVVKTDATSKSSGSITAKASTGQSTSAKGTTSSSGGTAKAASGSSKLPSMAAVQQATTNFAKDANTVSASLNQLPEETSATNIKSLATTAFKAESDEDAQRAVLAAAAGSAGSASNTKIVQNTPTVLKGLKAIMQKPTAATVKTNVATIQNSR
jgi:hypothetical protein